MIQKDFGMGRETRTIEIAGQTVYFGNSAHLDAVRSDSVDFFITSPPYWNLKRYGQLEGQVGHTSYEEYLEQLNSIFSECYRVARDGAVFVLNVNSRRNSGSFYPIAFDLYRSIRDWKLWDVLIWYIPNALPQPNGYMERLFDNKFEYLLVFLKGSSNQYKFHKPRVPQKYLGTDPRLYKQNERGRCIGSIFRIPAYRPPNIKALGYHEAAFPEELVALMLESFTDPGGTVLDPFLGSGTTLKVCRVMGRQGIGYELNEGYADLIVGRINEEWAVPDWRDLDILHSSTMETGMRKPRKIQFMRGRDGLTELLPLS